MIYHRNKKKKFYFVLIFKPLQVEQVIRVEPFVAQNRGPYTYSQPKKNAVPFTPTQVEAIKAGMQVPLNFVQTYIITSTVEPVLKGHWNLQWEMVVNNRWP